jgi:hypothetical protein
MNFLTGSMKNKASFLLSLSSELACWNGLLFSPEDGKAKLKLSYDLEFRLLLPSSGGIKVVASSLIQNLKTSKKVSLRTRGVFNN